MMGFETAADRSLALDILTMAANGLVDRSDLLVEWLLREGRRPDDIAFAQAPRRAP